MKKATNPKPVKVKIWSRAPSYGASHPHDPYIELIVKLRENDPFAHEDIAVACMRIAAKLVNDTTFFIAKMEWHAADIDKNNYEPCYPQNGNVSKYFVEGTKLKIYSPHVGEAFITIEAV